MTSVAGPRAVVDSVAAALQNAPAYRHLPAETQRSLMGSLGQIGGYLSADPPAHGLADPPAPGGPPQPAPGGGGTVGRAGELARATLNAVDFPSFVSGLVKGTFQAIVDATIQQMDAYATLLQEVAKTVDDYMRDNVTEDSARDYLADRYPTVLTRSTTSGRPSLDVDLSNPAQQLPTFFTDLGFDMPAEIDPDSLESVIVPAARKTMAEQRHQTLATMVLLGLNRIIISDGEINAKLQFHVDASETTAITFDSTQTSMGNMAGTSGKSTFSGNGIMVNTVSLNAQSDINLRTDLTGEVRVKFVSDVLPLSSFANSAAIQLINQNATVPSSIPLPPAADAPPASPGPAAATTPAQSLPDEAPAYDPWEPRR